MQTRASHDATRPPHATRVAAGPRFPSDERPPALVLGRGFATLGVTRSLGRARIPRYVVSSRPGPVRGSRWYRKPPFRDYLHAPEDLTEYLHRSAVERAVLIPTTEADALAVAHLPDELRARFRSSGAAPHLLDTLVDRGSLASLLAAHGVPHPPTVVVEHPAALARVDQIEVERAFIKPRDAQSFAECFGVRAFRPSGPLDLRAKLEWLTSRGVDVVVQEYVPGPPASHYFVDGFIDAGGVVRARLTRRRMRMFPLEFGASSASITVPVDQARPAVDAVEALLGRIGYRGAYSAEFKVDERDASFRLLEIDVRPWRTVEFAARSGVDVVRMVYRDALGLPVEDAFDFEHGRRLVYAPHDLAARRALRARGETAGEDGVRAMLTADGAVFAADDPVPALLDLGGLVRRTLGRWVGLLHRPGPRRLPEPRGVGLPSFRAPARRRRRFSVGPEDPGSRRPGAYPRSGSPSSPPSPGAARSS